MSLTASGPIRNPERNYVDRVRISGTGGVAVDRYYIVRGDGASVGTAFRFADGLPRIGDVLPGDDELVVTALSPIERFSDDLVYVQVTYGQENEAAFTVFDTKPRDYSIWVPGTTQVGIAQGVQVYPADGAGEPVNLKEGTTRIAGTARLEVVAYHNAQTWLTEATEMLGTVVSNPVVMPPLLRIGPPFDVSAGRLLALEPSMTPVNRKWIEVRFPFLYAEPQEIEYGVVGQGLQTVTVPPHHYWERATGEDAWWDEGQIYVARVYPERTLNNTALWSITN